LGGGQNGHLGLLLSNARYITLADTIPWETPGNPGPFVPPEAGTGPQIQAAKDVWKELKQEFELCQATEKALIAQLVDTIDPIYFRAMLNRATGQYSSSISALSTHLFTTYGQITPQQVKSKEMELYNMHYDISQPVDTVFNCIDDLSDLAEHASSPMTAQQMIDLAYVIFAKQTILQPDLRLWNRRPVAERTWTNMTTHFREAQIDLSSLPTAGDMFHQQPVHQANNVTSIADLVVQRLLDDPRIESPSLAPAEPSPSAAPTDVANSLQRRETDLQSREASMMAQMQDMMTMIRDGNNRNNNNNSRDNGNNSNNSRDNSQGRGRDRNDNRNTGGTTNRPRLPRAYCWTHGSCVHSSANCRTPATGHKTTATFANMQNGSKHGCYWDT
jgi:hypothetical protein